MVTGTPALQRTVPRRAARCAASGAREWHCHTQFSPKRDRYSWNAEAQKQVLLSDGLRLGSIRRRPMTTFKFFGALAILSTLTAAPALAQRMIEEPGMYAFY